MFLKKDEPAHIRKEWGRLRALAKKERERPQNQGCLIKLDYKQKAVLRDGEIIAKWDLGARGPAASGE